MDLPVPYNPSPTTPATPPIDPNISAISDRLFTSCRSETYRALRLAETEILVMPWGPRIDVIFDPKNAAGVVGGRVRLFARTKGAEVELETQTIQAPTLPVKIRNGFACDEYVVKANLALEPGTDVKESYVFARVYTSN